MILAGTNVLLDVVGCDPMWADWARRQLNAAAAIDDIVINGVIYAELSAGYQRLEQLDEMLVKGSVALVAIPRPALFLAGKAFLRYRRSGGGRTGALSDFLSVPMRWVRS